jgi:hypothetical protein
VKRFLLSLLAIVVLIASHFGAFALGAKLGYFQHALEENKVAIGNIDHSPSVDPQFREYLKARVYWNIAMYYPAKPGYLIQKEWDRGPVNSALLGDVGAAKDPTIPVLTWQDAIYWVNR